MMDTTIDELHRKKAAPTLSPSGLEKVSLPIYYSKQSEQLKLLLCPFCAARYRAYTTLLNKPTMCQSCYMKLFASEAPTSPGKQKSQTTLSATEKCVLGQNHITRSNLSASTHKNQLQPQKAQPQTAAFSSLPSFCTMCPFCESKYHLLKKHINKLLICPNCKKKFNVVEVNFSSLQQKRVPSKNPGTHLSRKGSSTDLSSCTAKVGEKRQRSECGDICNTQKHSNSEGVIRKAVQENRRGVNDYGDAERREESGETQNHSNSGDVIGRAVQNNRKGLSDNGDAEVSFSSLQQKRVTSKNPGTHLSGKGSSSDFSSCDVKVGEKRKRNEYGEICNIENHSKSEDVIGRAVQKNTRGYSDNGDAERREESGCGKQLHEVDHFEETSPDVINQDAQGSSGNLEVDKNNGLCDSVSRIAVQAMASEWSYNTQNHINSEDVIGKAVQNNTRGFNDSGVAERREELGWGKQLHEVDRFEETSPNVINTNQTLNKKQDTPGSSGNVEVDNNSGLRYSVSGVAVQPKNSDKCVGSKFYDFDKRRKEINFEVGQMWALCDAADGMPRLYAQIRKVLAPSFGLRITYLEPDPDDEKEIQWFEEELPVSVGKFRLGKNHNTKDPSIFSHRIRCYGENITGPFTVSPRKGEIWALFKNWDIDWSSEPDSHRKYEYEFVEIMSDYADGAGLSVAFLHKAKGFASVFFRMEAGDADISQILPQSLYRFSHRIPSFKMTRVEGKGVPKDAYELDQAALPETIEEIIVPSHLLAEPKPKALSFPSKGKVFQTGQIWSFYSGNDKLHVYYCRIQKITLIQAFEEEPVFKLHVSRLKATPFPENVIQYEDKKMPIGCGTFLVRKIFEILTADDVSHKIVPKISMDGNEYTILPKIGDVWAIYRFWSHQKEFKDVGYCNYDIVEVLDDVLDYKVLELKLAFFSNENEDKVAIFRAAASRHPDCVDEDGTQAIFTIPKAKMLRFSHQIPASRVTKEVGGVFKELYEVDSSALPTNVRFEDH